MTTQIIINDDVPVYVELAPNRGEQDVGFDLNEILDKSTEALNNSMIAIFGMAQRMASTVRSIPLVERPNEVQMEFGLKADLDGNAYIVKGSLESHINVTLTWKEQKKQPNKNSEAS